MPYRKKLIEVALPLDAINAESAREKSIRHGHPSTLHLWWARRPLATCRAVLFASLVDDPAEPAAPPAYLAALDALPKPDPLPLLWDGMTVAEQRRERLFSFIARLVKWENSNDERIIGTARELINLACEGKPPAVLDPFCGGGSIPLEAQRLGLEAHASDLNPVAVLITKALIEIPPKFANRPPVNPDDRGLTPALSTEVEREKGRGRALRQPQDGRVAWKGAAGLAADVRYYGKWMRDEAEKRIGHLYPKARLPGGGEATVIAWLWARTVRCPNPACGAQMPLVRSFALSTKPGKQAWVEPHVDRSVTPPVVHFEVRTGNGKAREGTVGRGGAVCIACGTVAPLGYIGSEGRAGRMGTRLMAIVAQGQRERIFLPASPERERASVASRVESEASISLSTHPQYMGAPRYGLALHKDLFTPRQFSTLTVLTELVVEAAVLAARSTTDQSESRAAAVATYLGLAVGRMADLNNSLCQWSRLPSKLHVGHLFMRQAVPMTWDFAEANPLGPSAGGWDHTFGFVPAVLNQLPAEGPAGHVSMGDAAREVGSRGPVLLSTDPPYYDNVPYADLSDFFYVWLRRSLLPHYPELLSTLAAPRTGELVADQVRFGGREPAKRFFEAGLRSALLRGRMTQDDRFPATIYYAFKQMETQEEARSDGPTDGALMGWESMLHALLASGFQITGTLPMRSERSARTRALGSNALASSIVLVCRPRPENAPTASRAEFLEELGIAMRSALPLLASGQVAPVDLAQASIGPGMAVYSKYREVVRQDGRKVTVREALQDINNAIASYRSERVSSFDPETRFCLAWYEQHGYGEGAYGDADNLARSQNVGPEAMQRDGLLAIGRGRARLEPPASYASGSRQPAAGNREGRTDDSVSAWEACLRLAITLEREGEAGAAALARELGEGAAARARELAVWLYTIADAKKRSDDAYLFNALDASWGAIQEQVARQGAGQQAQF